MENKKPNKDLLFGIRAVIEAIHSDQQIDKVFLQRGLSGELMNELLAELKKHDVAMVFVPKQKLDRITRKNHQGAIAFICPIEYVNLEEIVINLFEQGKTPFILILDRITDVRNFGAICRTAECAGIHAIVVPEKGAAQINADTIKTSTGAIFKLNICREKNLKNTIKLLQNSGIQVIACTEKTNDLIYSANYTFPTAVVMGSEENGISIDILRGSDKLVKIPMKGEISSLNVSVAASLIMYEGLRQRG